MNLQREREDAFGRRNFKEFRVSSFGGKGDVRRLTRGEIRVHAIW